MFSEKYNFLLFSNCFFIVVRNVFHCFQTNIFAFVLYVFIYLIRHAIVVFLIVFCPVLRYNLYGIMARFSA